MASSDASAVVQVSRIKEGETSDCEGDIEGRRDGSKRMKMRDLESVLGVEGIRSCSLDSSTTNELKVPGHDHKEERHSEILVATTSVLSDTLASETTCHSSVEHVPACLTLGPAGSTNPFILGHENVPISAKEISRQSFPIEKNEGEQGSTKMTGLTVDLNSIATSSTAEHDFFYPYKKLGQIKPADASESGSTTGPVEESEPLRVWKEMKQNGFLSSSRGSILMPKQQVRQPRKRKYDELKRKTEFAKREQVNRFNKIAAPCGLLSGLNPGIINHVRNSKQVHSIIDAIVHSEKRDNQTQNRITDQAERGIKETSDRRKEHICSQDSTTKQVILSEPCIPPRTEYPGENEIEMVWHTFHQGACATSQLTTECEGDALKLKVSSATARTSENVSSATIDEFSANQENVDSLSLKAANVASQWLDLLQQDIKGRIAALRRSKKRVRNVIQTELPYLLSKEFTSNQENEPNFAQSSEAGSTKAISEMHVVRWRSLFSQMDKTLYEEGKHLESWLKQVQEMQLHCENGLKFVSSGASSHLNLTHDSSKLKKSESTEREYAVRAAAASIYSTCNLIMTRGNVQCF
ncbi:unnamed protein product [Musa acuminata subsp. malaccensis]|uniref:(wild Malaysian banana) hypothetical protein n=1 Tax=Musa acuminata subsp. malaccensis TaxID=214687 RepID=A0A804IA91_MUSAM|nr:PREDICTED: uncharacterized protein LOC103978084 isoform X2 [Musa acuminata subsp. malaccensis]CAG1849661.1 unnamed protein product [Musa acuminata subsp. malaccensis]